MEPGPLKPDLTLIIPAFNEEKLIGSSLDELLSQLSTRKMRAEIIIVDDGSTDQTASIVTDYQTRHPRVILLKNERNRGKGYSIRRAVLQSTGEIIIFIDADLPYAFESVQLIFDVIKQGTQLAIGSRVLPESELSDKIPLVRNLAGQTFSLLIRLLLFPGIPDTQCGLKGFRDREAKIIFEQVTIDGFGFDVEVLYLARRLGYKIQCVPVNLVFSRLDSRVRLLKDSFHMLFDLLRIRLNAYKGKYSVEEHVW